MKTNIITLVIFLQILGGHVLAQETFYINPSSTTLNLENARDQIRTINDNMDGDITVILKNGVHRLDHTFELNEEDGGTNGFNVIWKAETQGEVFFSGGKVLNDWILHDADKNIYKAFVGDVKFRQIYVNGERGIRARTPNRDGDINLGPYNRTTGVDITNKTISIKKEEIAKWDNFNKIEMIFYPSWYHYRLLLKNYEIKDGDALISFASDTEYAFKKSIAFYTQAPYFFENAYEFLDEQGEWYLNESEGTVYYKPLEGEEMSKVEIVIPQTKTLVSIKGSSAQTKVKNISFEGVTFAHTTWTYPSDNGLVLTQAFQPQPMTLEGSFNESIRPPGAVRVDFGESINFYNNTFTQLGANGLCYFIGNTNCEVDHNTFEYISGNGLVIDAYNALAPKQENQTRAFKIKNNFIQHVGMDYTNGIAVLANRVSDLLIENNTITNLPYTAIQVGNQPKEDIETATENISISYNDISNFTNIHSDGGAIYTLGPQPGCIIKENYIHDWERPEYESKVAPSAGIYLDNYGQYMVVERNFIEGYPLNTPRTHPLFVQATTFDYFLMNHLSTDECIKFGAGIDHEKRGCRKYCNELSVPKNLKIEFNTLTWDKVPGASGYLVWMSTYMPGKYTKFKDVGNNTELSLSSKYYAVQAYGNQPSCKSNLSEEIESGLSPVGGRLIELEKCEYRNMQPDSSQEYFNKHGLRYANNNGQNGEIIFMHGWPTDNFRIKVGYLAAQKGTVKFQLSVAGECIDTWDSAECKSGLCVRTTQPLLVENGDEIRLTIVPIKGAAGQVDYIEMIPVWE